MRLMLGCVLLMILPLVHAAAKTLEIDVNQQKVALPYWSPLKKTKGGVVVVYGDPPIYGTVLAKDLSQQLADLGWSVLLIVPSEPSDEKWVEQIPPALAALRMKDNNRLVVIHYGEKLFTSLDYFAKPQAKQVNGLVLLSAYDDPEKKETLDLVTKLSFPTYDIRAQFDYDAVLQQAHGRREATSQNKDYRVLLIPGARHQYLFALKMVATYLHGWMLKLPVTEPAKPPITLNPSNPTNPQQSVK